MQKPFLRIEYTCENQTIDIDSNTEMPQKGTRFGLQKIVDGVLKNVFYRIEAVFVQPDFIQCDCSIIQIS